MSTPDPVAAFQALYQRLDRDNLDLLDTVYHPDVEFEDPLHRIHGLAELREYFRRLYANVESIGFVFHDRFASADAAMMTWTMELRHRRLGEVSLPGASHIRYGRLITAHRDYFDAGAMLYERLPVLGPLVRAVRRRV